VRWSPGSTITSSILASRRLLRGGKELELTTKEFGVLAHFLRRRGCALTGEDLLNAVWGDSVAVTPRSIDRCVATLRRKIERDPRRPKYIRTIRDIGYRLEIEEE
jgi:DNA-binding response OmpR family regulator